MNHLVNSCAFQPSEFCRRVQEASGAEESAPPNAQTQYLAAYLQRLGATHLIEETQYIDRHFIDEVSAYYSTCLSPTPNRCHRLHALRFPAGEGPGPDELTSWLASGIREAARRDEFRDALQNAYLGCIVVRPIPSVPIGRTLIRPPNDDNRRRILTARTQRVHLLGIEIAIECVPFQQQDLAVAACATTAAWSALASAHRLDGQRGPTPSQITRAATRRTPATRRFPSGGLGFDQICAALDEFGYAPHTFFPQPSIQQVRMTEFRFTLNTYLKSGIPIIVATVQPGASVGHAITLTGYRADTSGHCTIPSSQNVQIRNVGSDQYYLHDDRLGPYARATIGQQPFNQSNGTQLREVLQIPVARGAETSLISAAAVPIYEKLRARPQDLLKYAMLDRGFVLSELSAAGSQLGIELWFQQSGAYLSSLVANEVPVDPERLADLLCASNLSRYIGVVRWFIDDAIAIDSLWDTTDIARDQARKSRPLGIVSLDRQFDRVVSEYADALGCPAG